MGAGPGCADGDPGGFLVPHVGHRNGLAIDVDLEPVEGLVRRTVGKGYVNLERSSRRKTGRKDRLEGRRLRGLRSRNPPRDQGLEETVRRARDRSINQVMQDPPPPFQTTHKASSSDTMRP